jgi:hypothetical protein
MNSNLEKCAIIELYHGQFKIIETGDYVLCSITKQKIPLENLKYWNVDLQEIYFGPEVALKRYKEINEI